MERHIDWVLHAGESMLSQPTLKPRKSTQREAFNGGRSYRGPL
jgi:hypothetical protein